MTAPSGVPDYLAQDVSALKTRLTALEEYVHLELTPKLDKNTEITAFTSALVDEVHTAMLHPQTGVKVQNDQMFNAYTMASNAIKMLSWAGDRAVGLAEKGGKIARFVFWLAAAMSTGYGAFNAHRFVDFLKSFIS